MRGRRSLALASLLVLGALLSAQGVDAGAGRALLVRGPVPVKGLPFFAPNVLRALSGAYSLEGSVATKDPSRNPGGGGELPVWYTREGLVLAGAWKRAEAYGSGAYLLGRGEGAVLLLKTGGYYLFFELPSASVSTGEEKRRRAFIRAFDRKFLAFFRNAGTDAELSFPAFVDY